MASLTLYTASAQVTKPITKRAFKDLLFEKRWFLTWEKTYPNGVVRVDYFSFEVDAEPIDLDMVLGEDGNVFELRVLTRKEGVLEKFQEAIGDLIEPFDIHRADIGVIQRAS